MLRRDPLDPEDALRRVLIANCDGVLIGRGVIQSLKLPRFRRVVLDLVDYGSVVTASIAAS